MAGLEAGSEPGLKPEPGAGLGELREQIQE